jgi:hypothetical protein
VNPLGELNIDNYSKAAHNLKQITLLFLRNTNRLSKGILS